MRNAKKYLKRLKDSGLGIVHDGRYWLNGDAGLKASQRQKLRKFIGWLERLPEKLKNNFNFDKKVYVESRYYINDGKEQVFGLYGYGYTLSNKVFEEHYIFEIKVIVNDLDESNGFYLDHWDGFKKWLKDLDVNNLDNYLYDCLYNN